jgi:hypothetical protein
MALLMSFVMSFIISVFNVGFVNDIVIIWMKAWGLAFSFAFPTVFIISPAVHRLVEFVLKTEE